MCNKKEGDEEGDEDLLVISLHCDRPYAIIKAEMVALLEKEYFAYMLRRANGVITKTAEISGTDRKHIRRLMNRHGLKRSSQTTKEAPQSKFLRLGRKLYLFVEGKNISHKLIPDFQWLFEKPRGWNHLQQFLQKKGMLFRTNNLRSRPNYEWNQERIPEEWKTTLLKITSPLPPQ